MLNLPPLVLFNDYPSFNDYIEAVYSFFRDDFLNNRVFYLNKPVICYPDPVEQGKEASFWHVITKDYKNGSRPLDTKRSERIRWPKPVIEGFKDESVKVWEEIKRNKKGKKQSRVHFCFGDWDYLVVLTRRPNHWIICTAYPILDDDERGIEYKNDLQERYNKFLEKQTPPF